ncbi:MAG: hypothetical protein CMM47_09045 [Rhodospirillaceae bacterium]|nr:hypothetical protein [Rhodospirillaceae bacterium]
MIRNGKSRRYFLGVTAGAGATILSSTALGAGKQIIDLLNPQSPIVLPPNFYPSIWFTMESNGRTTVHIFKAEMGQHVGTAFAQIVAEQLCLNWIDVEIDYPEIDHNTFLKYGGQITGGSYSIHEMFDRLSRESAVARRILLEAGAELIDASFEDCIAKDGLIVDTIMDQRITYSEILSETTIDYEISDEDLRNAPLIQKANYKIIGKPVTAVDISEKVNGAGRFGIDAFVPNMKYAKVIVPPTRHGAKIKTIEDTKAKSIAGYIATLPLNFPDAAKVGGFVTDIPLVIAENYPAALRASRLVEVDWELSDHVNFSTQDLLSSSRALIEKQADYAEYFKTGDIALATKASTSSVEREYVTNMVTHAPLEPASALAHFADDKLHIYAGHQAAPLLPELISLYTGIDKEKIVFYPHLIGGGFGARVEIEPVIFASIAALTTKEPIKIIFTREDDMGLGHPRSPSVQRLTAYMNDDKAITGLRHDLACGWIVFGAAGLVYPIKDGKADQSSKDQVQLFSVSGSDHWYDVPNTSVRAFRNLDIEKVVSNRAVRSVANNYTVFAIECFMDELAEELDTDPVDLRLSLLKGKGVNSGGNEADLFPKGIKPFWNTSPYQTSSSINGGKRLANVLRTATGLANYNGGPVKKNVAQGVAVAGAEERTNPSFCACVATVEVVPESYVFYVQKLDVVIDLGLVINPDGADAQIEGSVLWGLSNSLFEQLNLKQGSFVETNFDTYKWQNIVGIPEINLTIVENGDYPTGAGEPATSVVGPAICNAIYNASGARIRTLPITQGIFAQALGKVQKH